MIALLTGQLASKTPERIIIDVNGVGYQVAIPLSTYYSLPDEGSTTLHIFTHVREDALLLFGFLSSAEKEMFIMLLSISGIGPKVALNILSHMSCADLYAALTNEDAKQLATLPGIGKKTAERLILELRDKVGKLSFRPNATPEVTARATVHNINEDALSALINLGYKEKQAAAVLAKIDTTAHDSMETILKIALKHLIR
jgi:Holliday junction DNA helicase RuvA